MDTIVDFEPGQLVATNFALAVLSPLDLVTCFERHINGDWGDLSDHDKALNTEALESGGRILSAYYIQGIKVWVLTEADRSQTTFLLPFEY